MRKSKGITLIALVVTIIVLLILAGVTIVTLTGDNGILTNAGNAKNTNEEASIEEEIRLAWNKLYADSYLDSTVNKAEALKKELDKNGYTATVTPEGEKLKVEYRDKLKILNVTTGSLDDIKPLPTITAGQKAPSDSNAKYTDGKYTAVIPAGFTVSSESGENSIETGLVIRDDSDNEFVWIPVGIPKKSNSNETITLGRYVFDEDGSINVELSKTGSQDQLKLSSTDSMYFTEGLKDSNTGNAHAKDIEKFIEKTNAAGGFWIGRYEARTGIERNKNNKSTLTQITEKATDYVYNYIMQPKAAEQARGMYSSDYFESDLINSYAWDTAILFLQEYDNRTEAVQKNSRYKAKYSRQIKLSSSAGLKTRGTNASSVADSDKDEICNVYDMADNCTEWTTETSSFSEYPCVRRGVDGYSTRTVMLAIASDSTRPLLGTSGNLSALCFM